MGNVGFNVTDSGWKGSAVGPVRSRTRAVGTDAAAPAAAQGSVTRLQTAGVRRAGWR